jgi:hypothetical protein
VAEGIEDAAKKQQRQALSREAAARSLAVLDGRARLYDFSTGGTTAELIAIARKRMPRQLSAEERGRHLPPPLNRPALVFSELAQTCRGTRRSARMPKALSINQFDSAAVTFGNAAMRVAAGEEQGDMR